MDITVIIKTMIRPKGLTKLIKSLLSYYPDISIIIADDGNPSSKQQILSKFPNANIEYYELPQDCGLSYGRNYMLERVKTAYFLLCDDDFMIDQTLKLPELISMIEAKQLDILGGYIRNYKIVTSMLDRCIVLAQRVLHYEICTNYIGKIEQRNDSLIVHYKRKAFPEFEITDLCPNFFIANTERVKAMGGWDEALKLQEHTEFFLRAKIFGLKVGSTNQMSVKHFPVQTKGYSEKRNRDFSALFLKKHGIQRAYYYYDDDTADTMEYFTKDGVLINEPITKENVHDKSEG